MKLRVRHVPTAVVALLLISASAFAATTLINTISNATSNEVQPFKNFDPPTPAVADFNGDGKMELVSQNDNQYVYVLSATSSNVLAEFRPPYPSGWGARPINDVAIADVDGDGLLSIIVVTSAGRVCDYEYSPGWTFTQRWCSVMDGYSSPGADAGPAVADVDGDGKLEIFSQTEQKGLYAFNWDGSVRWSKNEWGGNAGPIITDLEHDGKKDVIFFSDGGTIKAYDASSGNGKWSFWSSAYVSPGSVPIAGNAADIDGDGKEEVVYAARHAPLSNTDYTTNHLMIFVLSHTGSLQSRWQPSWGNPMSYTHPALVDVNGDGVKDIVMQDWNTIGHKPGEWERLGPANVFAYTHNGNLLWRTVMENSWSNDNVAVADVDGDGKMEVLTIGYNGGSDGMWYLDLATGAKEAHVPAGGSWQVLRGPIAGDLDGSGKTGWAASYSTNGNGGAWRVYRTDAPCKVEYGGFQYADPCRKGTGGGGGGGGGSPPPSSGFTFEHGGGNEWWIEGKVSPKPESVQAMDTNGGWVTLDFKSWGEWAASFRIEPGHQVRFRALSSGTWFESCWFSHPGGTADCSGGGSGGGGGGGGSGFAATFTNARGNNWWVESDVSVTGGTLAGVDARVNGGNWIPLDKKSWGSWAKSFQVLSGSTVEFRARASDGQTATSSNYTWPPS